MNKKNRIIVAIAPKTNIKFDFSHLRPIKKAPTKVAFMDATRIATGVFNKPKSTLEIATVNTVRISNATNVI